MASTSSGLLSIDLSAIQANWRLLAEHCGRQVNVGAVIKANAYGVGAREVGEALYKSGCRAFFFANLDEALVFKACGHEEAVIYVLGGARSGDEKFFIDTNLIPVLFSPEAILRWAAACEQANVASPSVIKIDTGMTRLGLSLHELALLCADRTLLEKINPVMVMSHLACADEPWHSLNAKQLSLFQQGVESIKLILPNVRFSLANSSGIFLGSNWHFDLVRPGAALYGINPVPGNPNPLQSAVQLSLPILQIRRLDCAATVGYGAGVAMPQGARLAVVAGGYADGLHRTLGLQPEGILCGQRVKAVGRMSMDLTIFDITHVDASDDSLINSSIEVINDQLTLDYLIQKNNLLGYEVLTSLGARYRRVYKGGDKDE